MFGEKSGKLWSINNKVGTCEFGPVQSDFLEDQISSPRGCCPSNFCICYRMAKAF